MMLLRNWALSWSLTFLKDGVHFVQPIMDTKIAVQDSGRIDLLDKSTEGDCPGNNLKNCNALDYETNLCRWRLVRNTKQMMRKRSTAGKKHSFRGAIALRQCTQGEGKRL